MLKRTYKRVLRILLYSVLAGLIFYALLPWLLPMGLVRRKLTAQLERDFGRPVQMGPISVRWGDGVQIRDLVIQRKRKYGAGQLLRVGRVHTSFAPLKILYSGLDVVLMEDVDFYVVATEDDLNILDMPPLEMSQLTIDKATVHFETHLDGQISKAIFEVGSTVMDNDKATGAFAWEFAARQLGQNEPAIVSRGQIGRFEHPSGDQNERDIRISLRNLDLSMLGIDRWIHRMLTGRDTSGPVARSQVGTIQGTCSAEVRLQLSETQEMSGQGWFELTDMEVTGRDKEGTARLWGAVDTISGQLSDLRYDPVTHWIHIGQWGIESPGLVLKGECEYDPREGAGVFLRMKVRQGQVEPTVLAQTMPVWDSEVLSGWFGDGWVHFEAEYQAGERAEFGRLALNGTNWECKIGGITKPAGEILKFELSYQMSHDEDELCLSVDTLQWASLQGQGTLVVPDWYSLSSVEPEDDSGHETRDIFHSLVHGSSPSHLQASMAVGDISEFSSCVSTWLGSAVDVALSGSMQVEITTQGRNAGQEFSLQVQLPASARCVWSEGNKVVWQKEAGRQLGLTCSGQWNPEESAIENAALRSVLGTGTLSFGPGRLVFRDDAAHSAEMDTGVGSMVPAGSVPVTSDITGHLQSPLLAQADGPWQIKGVSDWLAALPALQTELSKQGVDLRGALAGDMKYRHNAHQDLEWSDQIDFTDLQIQVFSEPSKHGEETSVGCRSLLFQKPVGEIGTVSISAKEDYRDHEIEYCIQGQMGAMKCRGKGRAVRLVSAEAGGGPVRHRYWDIEGDIKRLEDIPRYFVGFWDEQGWCGAGDYSLGDLKGRVHLTGQWSIGELAESFDIGLDGSHSGFVLAEKGDANEQSILWAKQSGNPFTIRGEMMITEKDGLIGALIGKPDKPSPSRLVNIETLQLEAAGLSAEVTGDLVCEIPEDSNPDWQSMVRQVKLRLEGDLDHAGVLGQEIPHLGELQNRAGLHGSTHLDGSLNWHRGQKRLECGGTVDLTQTESTFRWLADPNRSDPVQIAKPVGDPLRFSFAFGVGGESDVLDLDAVRVQLGGNTVHLSGQLRGVRWSDWPTFETRMSSFHDLSSPVSVPAKEADWHLHIDAPELEDVAKWVNPSEDVAFSGRLKTDLKLFQQYEPTTVTYWNPSTLTGVLHWKQDRRPMELHLRDVELSSARLVVPEATLRIGDNHLTLVADITEPIISRDGLVHELQQPKGRIDVLSGKLDLDDMQEFLHAGQKKPSAAQLVSGTKTPHNLPSGFRYEDIREFLSKLQRCDLTGRCEFDNLSFTDPVNSVRMDLDKMVGRYEVADGVFHIQFAAGLGGGAVEGRIRSDLNQDVPVLEYSQTARQLRANEMLRGIVESEFPGLEVTGTISEKKTLTGDWYRILSTNQGWQGKGVTQCSQGVLFGPGGPGWMLRVFPGLKLVKYDWHEFTNEYDLSSDGTKKNNMLFKGAMYNIYIDGVSKPIRKTSQYQEMIQALETDLQAGREKLKALQSGELELRDDKARRLRIQTAGLEQLWQKHRAGQILRSLQADYNVGGLISAGGGKKFKTPTEILRIPIFRAHSYIVERYMVGIQTRDMLPGPL